ncbi:MAG: ParB N-terminal domain-containing protein [Faecalibacterium prausnitzii]
MEKPKTYSTRKGAASCLNARNRPGNYSPAHRPDPARRPFRRGRSFDEQELTALAQSIRENGLLQPVTVRRGRGWLRAGGRGAAARAPVSWQR